MEYVSVNINDIELDKDNPRIKHYLTMYSNDVTAEGIALALNQTTGGENTSSYNTLKESIKENGGIINPILVNRQEDGKLVVVEGNTRLQIYKDFVEKKVPGNWNEIICLVYDNLPEERIHAIRLQSHLVGPRDWDAFSKAKYLHELSNVENLSINSIISFCGGKKTEIIKFIDAYHDMQDTYFKEAELRDQCIEPRDFSKFVELQNSKINFAIKANGYNKNDFAKWVIDKKVDTAQNVRNIPAILNNAIAEDVFLKSDISEAVKHLNAEEKGTNNIQDYNLDDLVKELTQRFKNIQYSTIRKLREDEKYESSREGIYDLKIELQLILDELE